MSLFKTKELCKYCGREEHKANECWQQQDHNKLDRDYLHPYHCLHCVAGDHAKGQVFLEEKKKELVCGDNYDRHQWIYVENQVAPINSSAMRRDHLAVCGDCGKKNIIHSEKINYS